MSEIVTKPSPAPTRPAPRRAETRFRLPPDMEVVVNTSPSEGEPRVRVEPEAGAKGRYVDVRG